MSHKVCEDDNYTYYTRKVDYFKSSKIIFECFDSFTQKSEQIGKCIIDEWAQIQAVDGTNAITNLLAWTDFLNVSFLIFLF